MTAKWKHANLRPGVRGRVADSIQELRNQVVQPAGNIWYVSRNVAASKGGKTWDTAFKTFKEAIAQVNADFTAAAQPDVGRNTVIYVGEGWYGETPTTLTASDCHIIGTAPGSHDSIVIYGSATAGGFDNPSAGPALIIEGSNNTIENIGFFTHDPLYMCVRDGAHSSDGAQKHTYNNAFINCNFVRDSDNGSFGGIDVVSNEGPYIIGCRFSTSTNVAAIRIRSNGDTNPVGVRIEDCHFVGTPIGIQIVAGHQTFIRHNFFYDDTTDRSEEIDTCVDNAGSSSTTYIENYAEFTEGNQVVGGTSVKINNFQLA